MAAERHLTVEQSDSLQQLRDAIEMERGDFSLIFAHCGYRFLRDRLIEELLTTLNLQLESLDLEPTTTSLLKALEQYFSGREQSEFPDGILIKGFESAQNLSQLLGAINQVRESLKRDFPMPMVFWITPDVLKEIMNIAPDLESWAIGIQFQATGQDLGNFIKITFANYFESLKQHIPTDIYLSHEATRLLVNELRDIEANFLEQLNPNITACLFTLMGVTQRRIYHFNIAIEYHKKACQLYQDLGDRFGVGCAYYFLSRTYYSLAFSDQEYISHISPDGLARLIAEQQQEGSLWQQAYDYMQKALEAWRSCEQEDAITWAFLRWQQLLSYLEKWDELEKQALQSLEILGDRTSDIAKLLSLKIQFWLGDALLFQGKIERAKDYLETVVTEIEDDRFIYALAHQSLAKIYSLADIYQEENQLEKALQLLTEAEKSLDGDRLSRAHVRLLEQKRDILFKLGRYLEAYKAKERKQLAEYKYSFKSFIGAIRIQPRRDEIYMSEAIRASGRGKDVKKLVNWIVGKEHAVTVIYGYSGVGKSSLVNAGLIPELAKNQRSAPNGYVQVLLRSYRDWQQKLLDALQAQVPFENGENKNIEQQIFVLLQECDRRNQLVVLIFDQFEEFFFTYENELERQPFFELLGQLTNETTRVNIVLSLRRDYIHFLLGRDQLKRGTKVIDLLSRENSYELKNFSRDEAIKVFQGLTARTSFQPDQDLIEAVVDDLIDPAIGRVRPIELQIIGRQLEETAGGITNLAKYQQQALIKGVKEKQSPKAALVRSYLNAVVKDCGTEENKQLASQLMFLLTDEQGRRPIKSAEELETEIKEIGQSTQNVGMILQILVLSDLVSEVQERESETVKYQLVHDYLVEYVRANKEQNFAALLQEEVAKRKVAERTLKDLENDIFQKKYQQQQLNTDNKLSQKILLGSSVGILLSVFLNVIFLRGAQIKKQQVNEQLDNTLAKLEIAEATIDNLGGELESTKSELEKLQDTINDVEQEPVSSSNPPPSWVREILRRNGGSGAQR